MNSGGAGAMGVSMSWLAVKDCSREAALEALGFELTGAEDNQPLGSFCVGALPGGWLLFVADRDLDILFKPEFAALSRHGPAVGCAIEEHVMFAQARGFGAGVENWRVTRDSESGDDDVEVIGDPPAALADILTAATAEQDRFNAANENVDVVFVPIDLAARICGFRHDEWLADLNFAEVRRARGAGSVSTPSFLQRLFGRR